MRNTKNEALRALKRTMTPVKDRSSNLEVMPRMRTTDVPFKKGYKPGSYKRGYTTFA